MKRTRNISIILLSSFFILSFATRNNFNPNGKDLLGLEDAENVKASEIKKMVDEKVVTPIYTCLQESNPHLFMMKCYSGVDFVFDEASYNTNPEAEAYSNYPVSGKIFFTDCEVENFLCAVKVTYSTSDIQIQESYFSPWVTPVVYLESFCSRLKEKTKE